jgi:hypothetical protein
MMKRFHWNGSKEVKRKYWRYGKFRQRLIWGADWYHYLLQDVHNRRPVRSDTMMGAEF